MGAAAGAAAEPDRRAGRPGRHRAAGRRGPAARAPAPPAASPTTEPVPARRLEQHFVYNALNTIAALIRTDPGRARELLFGFADLSRAADQPGDATSTLDQELDAVRGYLQLEQARFGRRLRVELDLDGAAWAGSRCARCWCWTRCGPPCSRASSRTRKAASLLVRTSPADGGCAVTVAVGPAEPVVIALPLDGAAVPG